MKAIIVAAGIGSRLGDLTKDLPKPLIDVNGKSILERQIELFKKFGIDDIIIIRGPHKNKFNFEQVTYVDDVDTAKHDLLGSLMTAKKEMFDDIIISYGDIIFDENILSQLFNSTEDTSLAIDYNWEKNYNNKLNFPIQGLRPMSKSLPKGLKTILKKGGYNYASIINYWSDLVGKQISDVCYPKSIKTGRELKDGILHLNVFQFHNILNLFV